IYTQASQYRVVLESDGADRLGPQALRPIHLTSAAGGQVPLSALVRLEERATPLLINHIGQFPAVMLSFNLAPGVSLGEAVAVSEQVEREIGLAAGILREFQGAAQAFRASRSEERRVGKE